MPRPGPGERTPGSGRAPGQPNKLTSEIRDMIHEALEGAGGVGYLREQARDNPQAFLALVGKIVPREVHADIQGLDAVIAALAAARSRIKALDEPPASN